MLLVPVSVALKQTRRCNDGVIVSRTPDKLNRYGKAIAAETAGNSDSGQAAQTGYAIRRTGLDRL